MIQSIEYVDLLPVALSLCLVPDGSHFQEWSTSCVISALRFTCARKSTYVSVTGSVRLGSDLSSGFTLPSSIRPFSLSLDPMAVSPSLLPSIRTFANLRVLLRRRRQVGFLDSIDASSGRKICFNWSWNELPRVCAERGRRNVSVFLIPIFDLDRSPVLTLDRVHCAGKLSSS